MSAGLTKHLRKKTDEDGNTRILMSQWEFDEKLVGKSLENVGSYYPHFSSHNESHSQQILVNIERLLGNNIEKLTATDTWLILEAAYWHDIGMLFNADEVQKVFEKDDFKEYVESLANDNTQDLHEFAKVWYEDGWNKALVNHSDPHTGVEKYRQMIAEWYRRGHAKNSNSVVLDPFEKLGISSPRTELLPKRIYRYLGQICWAHGLGFDDYVMKTLPFRQTGMGTENCHPRFVACLLRLGDLFDIDDNRFCPVMARQVGNMPSFSETHKHKHQAIREFQLDNETVSITAICSTEMAYIECRNWFDWIREEIQNQMSQWKNIVPSRDFGLLPTINKLDVEMTDKKILLNDKPMKFSLDERSAIELLQGNNLYKDDMSIYRELIQNAIDATMIRVWLEHGQERSAKKLAKNANPYESETRKLFADYPIILDCKKVADNKESTLWEFSIEDNGVGISRKDLEYMQKIAGSKNNTEKKKIVRQMPEWMQPSGEFGIGLHSAFLLMKELQLGEQKITMLTKSRITHESLQIELNSPLSGKGGYCFIKKIDELTHYGTRLIVNIKILNSSIFENDKFSVQEFVSRIMYKYDSNELTALEKVLSIYKNVNNNTVNIKLNSRFNLQESLGKDKDYNIYLNRDNMYWDNQNQSAIKPLLLEHGEIYDIKSLTRSINMRSKQRIIPFYKGQMLKHTNGFSRNYFPTSFKDSILTDNLFNLIIDIYSSNTKDIVSLSRDEVKDIDIIKDTFLRSYDNLLYAIKNENYDSILLFDRNVRKKSLFLKLVSLDTDDKWKDFRVSEKYTIKDILSKDTISTYDAGEIENLEIIKNKEIEILNSRTFDGLMTNKIFRKILHDYGFITYYLYENPSDGNIISKKELENDLLFRSIEFDEISFSKSILESSKFTLDDILNAYTDKLNSNEYDIEATRNLLPIEKINFNFSPNFENEKLFRFIKIEVNKKDFIVFPFVMIKNSIVEVSNKKMYELFSSLITSKFEDYIEAYSILKDIVIDYAKDNHPEWYESYLTGKDFKPTDLTHLNELYKPSS